MGCDGGTIATRRDIVVRRRRDAREEQREARVGENNDAARARRTACAVSGDTLRPPCVADSIGHVFNKEAILRAILDHSLPSSLNGVVTIKTLKSINFADDMNCPVTQEPVGSAHTKYFALSPCGHVISDKALKMIEPVVVCPLCEQSVVEDRGPSLFPTTEEEEERRKNVMIEKKEKTEKRKKRRRRKNSDGNEKEAKRGKPSGMSEEAFTRIFGEKNKRKEKTSEHFLFNGSMSIGTRMGSI